ncbi:MAG: hypothetical protein ABW212_22030 [Pseudonocardia sediminis]
MSESSTEYADPGWPHEPSEAARANGPWAPIDIHTPARDAA